MSRAVILHVGAPKTGTSFVQDVLFRHRDLLEQQGVLYPAERFDAHFLAALDLMELHWGGLERQAVGAWDRLASRVRAWEGTAIVSHEILATASREQVRRALASFGDAEVHLVMSVRDLVRQIPAEWQENIKHRRTISYRDFLAAIAEPTPTKEIASWFWGVQEVPAVLDRWGRDLPAEQVHVITVPRPGAPPSLLWERFCAVLGLDPLAFDTEGGERSNPSMGVAETAFIRQVNAQVNDGVLGGDHYREFVRELLTHRTLSARPDMDRLLLPPEVRAWAADLSARWADELGSRGYQVTGSLDDLLPDPQDPAPYVDPDTVSAERLEDVALHSVVTLLRRAGELRDEIEDLHRRMADAVADRDLAVRQMGVVQRAKRRFVRSAETSRAAELALRGYRRARGR